MNYRLLLSVIVIAVLFIAMNVSAKEKSNTQEADAESIKALNMMQNAIDKMNQNHAVVGDSRASGSLSNSQGALTDENLDQVEGTSKIDSEQKNDTSHKK